MDERGSATDVENVLSLQDLCDYIGKHTNTSVVIRGDTQANSRIFIGPVTKQTDRTFRCTSETKLKFRGVEKSVLEFLQKHKHVSKFIRLDVDAWKDVANRDLPQQEDHLDEPADFTITIAEDVVEEKFGNQNFEHLH